MQPIFFAQSLSDAHFALTALQWQIPSKQNGGSVLFTPQGIFCFSQSWSFVHSYSADTEKELLKRKIDR